jgi:hypothetical protein
MWGIYSCNCCDPYRCLGRSALLVGGYGAVDLWRGQKVWPAAAPKALQVVWHLYPVWFAGAFLPDEGGCS